MLELELDVTVEVKFAKFEVELTFFPSKLLVLGIAGCFGERQRKKVKIFSFNF